jgi:hypothetical protein
MGRSSIFVGLRNPCMDLSKQSMGFTKSEVDPNLYYMFVGNNLFILVLYVDELFLTYAETLIVGCKEDMDIEFDMKDIGMMHHFLVLEVWKRPGEIFLGKGKYAIEILKRFQMEGYKPMATPMIIKLKNVTTSNSMLVDLTLYRWLIGSLMYLVNTRPNISFSINTLNEFMVDLTREHWVAEKNVLRYLRGTMEYGLIYLGDGEVKLQEYTNSDLENSVVDRKSTSGCCFSLDSLMIS